jgi:pyrroline-5-carboxylate reductase
MTKENICFIGAGNMGEALMKGCLSSNMNASNISFMELNEEKASYILAAYKLNRVSSYKELSNFSIIVLAVKPQNIQDIIPNLKISIKTKTTLVSILAGISIGYYKKYFPENPIIRVMPNTPCLINKGISVITPCNIASGLQIEIIKKIFANTGEVMIMEESKMNGVTALSGSGPAYFYHLIDVFAKEAQNIGIAYNEAKKLMCQTMLGSAEMLLTQNKEPQELIKQVKSPGGTTEAGLKILQTQSLRDIISNCLSAANNRALDLNIKE